MGAAVSRPAEGDLHEPRLAAAFSRIKLEGLLINREEDFLNDLFGFAFVI